MKTKMLGELKSRYSNLGLSDDQFNLVVPMAILGLPDDADDAAIAARASESYISDMLKNMQSQSDKIRSLEKKPKDEPKPGNKGDEPGSGKLDEVLALLKSQKEANDAMQARLEALEGANKTKAFDELVASVGKELNLSASMLDLCKQGLSSDMNEQAIRDALGAKKKALMEEGVRFDDGIPSHHTASQTDAEKKAAEDWVKAHEVK